MTREDMIILLEEINLAGNFVFRNTNILLSEKIKDKTRPEFTNFIRKLEKENSQFRSSNQQSSFFQNIKKKLKSIPELKLEIAFEPSPEFVEKIKQWFEEQKIGQAILDLSQNQGIVGGAVIEYQGKYKNLSVGKKIDQLFSHE